MLTKGFIFAYTEDAINHNGLLPPGEFFIDQIARDSFSREAGSGFVMGRSKSRAFFLCPDERG